MIALPSKVAPKKVQNGTKKWPHVMPARSNKGLGMDAHAKIPMKPAFSTTFSIKCAHVLDSTSGPSTSLTTSSSDCPERRAVLAIKYGGNSPIAVPNPHMNASTLTLDMI